MNQQVAARARATTTRIFVAARRPRCVPQVRAQRGRGRTNRRQRTVMLLVQQRKQCRAAQPTNSGALLVFYYQCFTADAHIHGTWQVSQPVRRRTYLPAPHVGLIAHALRCTFTDFYHALPYHTSGYRRWRHTAAVQCSLLWVQEAHRSCAVQPFVGTCAFCLVGVWRACIIMCYHIIIMILTTLVASLQGCMVGCEVCDGTNNHYGHGGQSFLYNGKHPCCVSQ